MNRPTTSPDRPPIATTSRSAPAQWPRTHCHQTDPYVAGLHQEWARLADGLELEPDVLALLDQARRYDQTLTSVNGLDDLVTAMHRHGDVPLMFAIEAAQAGSYVAARAIIQTMLPKLGRLAHSVREGRCFTSVVAEAVASMYEVIYRYPRHRRPHSVAGNLALDTLKALRLVLGSELPASATLDSLVTATAATPHRYTSTATPAIGGSDELAAILAEAKDRGFVSSTDAQLLWLVATGASKAEVADQFRITPPALRQRYARACRSLRARAVDLAA